MAVACPLALPNHAAWGTCSLVNGSLPSGASCDFECLPGFKLRGTRPSCMLGTLTNSSQCVVRAPLRRSVMTAAGAERSRMRIGMAPGDV